MKIALIGYGKMGKMIEQIALSRGHQIVSVIDIDNQEEFESEAFSSADVAIEFTSPHTALGNIQKAFSKGVKVVSGSTGWMEAARPQIKEQCEKGNTLFWSSNFSLGVAIFTSISNYLAHIMNGFQGYDVSMSETHHVHKLDAPSGTAISLAKGILEQLDRKTQWVKGDFLAPDGQLFKAGETSEGDLRIDSIREGEVAGIHTVTYTSDADEITITHNAKNRGGFALGAVLAAEYTKDHQGLLGMEDLFPFLKSNS